MSSNKSRQAERRAGGAKVFGAEPSKSLIPSHLLAALLDCGKQNMSSPCPLESDEQLASFLNALARDSSIGYEYGLTSQEIVELLDVWRLLTRNGRMSHPKGLVPEQHVISVRLERALYAEFLGKL